MRDLGGRPLPAWEAFVSVFGHRTAIAPGQGHISCRRIVPLAPILPAQARSTGVAAGNQVRPSYQVEANPVAAMAA
jgi:hypothetical protein